MPTVEELIAQRFNAYHEPRSDAFKTGFRATLEACVNHARTFCAYPRGTAEADAFFAGAEEARAFWEKNRI